MRIQSMGKHTDSPLLSVSCFLALLLGASLLIQGAGHVMDVSLVRLSLPLSALVSGALVYGYFFGITRQNLITLFIVALLLWLLGMMSHSLYDMTADGLGYQQPSAEAILNGWNPLKPTAKLLWQQIYPTGAWELEAMIASFTGSIEAAKMLHVWWLFIAWPLLTEGLRRHKGALSTFDHACIALMVLSPVLLCQMLTHYVDAMVYLAGLAFLGAMLLYGRSATINKLSLLLMGCCVLFIINAKLSGIYHAVALCAVAVVYIGMEQRRLPVKESLALMAAGIVGLLFLGFHPYATNLMTYGSLLHMDANTFTGFQRPANLAEMTRLQKFFVSLFAETGGAPRGDAVLKWPWAIHAKEWVAAGTPDARSGGFGLLFALGFVATWLLMHLHIKSAYDRRLLAVAGLLLASSLLFPENWWARYVPFAYAAVFFALLALPEPLGAVLRTLRFGVLTIFALNSAIAAGATYAYFTDAQQDFIALAQRLKQQPQGSVFLVPPGADYEIYNHAHMPLQRRLAALGVETSVRVDAPCPHMAANISEFKICY